MNYFQCKRKKQLYYGLLFCVISPCECTPPRRCRSHHHHHHRVGPYEAPGGILTMSADNHPPPMPVRSPRPPMARQRWAASSTIHPRARMMSVRKTPSSEVTISKTGGTSPTVHPSPCGQHTDSTMLPPLMPAPSL